MLVTLRGNSAKSKEKSAFITAWSYRLSPWCSPLCPAMNSHPMATAAENRSDTIVFLLEFPRRWQLSHGLLHMPVLRADWAGSRTWNLGPTRLLLPFGGCPVRCSCSREQRATPASVTPSRADEDVWLILWYLMYQGNNYFQQHSRTDYILNQWIQFVVEFAYSFYDVFFPIFTGKINKKALFIILITKLFWINY